MMATDNIVNIERYVQMKEKQEINRLPIAKCKIDNGSQLLNDMILEENQILVNYQHAINDTANDDLRELIINNRNCIEKIHLVLVKELSNLGEFQQTTATKPRIRDTYLTAVKLDFLYNQI